MLLCVLMLLYICPHTHIFVSSCCYMCPHAAIYVSSFYYMCVLMLLYLCPHAAVARDYSVRRSSRKSQLCLQQLELSLLMLALQYASRSSCLCSRGIRMHQNHRRLLIYIYACVYICMLLYCCIYIAALLLLQCGIPMCQYHSRVLILLRTNR